MNHIKYTKENGETSTRVIYPLSVLDLGHDNVKIQALDFSDMSDEERAEAEIVLNAIREVAKNAIYEAGFKSRYRSFFVKGVEID